MSNPTLRLGLREPHIDTNRPLTEGTVTVEGFDLVCGPQGGTDEMDAWDASFGGLLADKGRGNDAHISIPAFPNRRFRIAYIFIRSDAGIDRPKDLEGRRIALFAGDNTASIWSRGALKHYYGVDFSTITWCLPGTKGQGLGRGMTVEPLALDPGRRDVALDAKLLAGEVDAVIGPNILPSITRKDPRTRRLFPDYRREEQTYFRETGLFPISHVVTLNRTFVDRHPDAPVALLEAYRRARDVAFDRICGLDQHMVTLAWAFAELEAQRALMGETYWPYNVADNRRPLQAMMDFAHDFGVTPEKLNYETLFDPDAMALAGQ